MDKGIVDRPGAHSVEETVQRLKDILQAKGVTLFAVVDHSGEAEKVGLKMPPTRLVIFGSPKAGTPLMLAVPSPQYRKDRHGVPDGLLHNMPSSMRWR